jgi:aryl-alcohol dehydrogenase-like predicted oxidoreductase
LGGHSFIQQLGSDPRASEHEQAAIVATCLDHGICWFDTTYQPERIALGRVLQLLRRREEAKIIAWNFFQDFGPEENVGGPSYYQSHHIEQLLEQLQTDYIDYLVVHAMSDERENRLQEALAATWQAQGLVGALGVWHPCTDARHRSGTRNPYRFMVRPYNVTTRAAGPAFSTAKALGWETLACSPFVRGWGLERLLERAVAAYGDRGDLRARLADHILRHSLFQPHVDRLIVSMRRAEWVHANVASWRRGPLSDSERTWLEALVTAR